MLIMTKSAVVTIVLFLLLCCHHLLAQSIDCCKAQVSGISGGCETDTTYNNVTYTCETVSTSCSYCVLKTGFSSTECSQCCVASSYTCPSDSTSVIDSWSTWGKLYRYNAILLFICSSCLLCTLIFA
jgi:hypothetical protein